MSPLPRARPTDPFKEILVHIASGGSADAVIGPAVWMARVFAAHIDAVVAIAHSDGRQGTHEIVPAGLETVAAFEDTMRTAAHALRRFEAAAQEAGISYGKQVIADRAETIEQRLLCISRLYDLSIVVQPEFSASAGSSPTPILFDSGRPILLIPRAHTDSLALDHIAICWDGGRCAARAVHDAMPLIENARTVEIVAVNEGDSEFLESSSEALASHLARRRLNIKVRQPTAESADIHGTIMAIAAEAGSSLLIMGGYGHSKAGRFVPGRVTRDALHRMSVPTFMSF